MGKPGAFLECRRKPPDYRPVEERVRDFLPVERGWEEADVVRQAERCMACGTPFCHGWGCPLAAVIPEANDLVCRGHWADAIEVLLSQNPFPEFTGRVCPAPCEAACVLGLHDQPVAVRSIEAAIAEKGFASGRLGPRPPARRRPETVAVIGSGPAGLAAADRLNRAGVQVTVFEKDREPGGLLRYGIPAFKLDKAVVARRIRLMAQEGIGFETGVSCGTDLAADYLRRRFTAICLAAGARQPRDLDVPGRDLEGIHFALEYLGGRDGAASGGPIDAAGRDIIILGGGDTGADCLGTAIRQGARRVRQIEILPRPPAERPACTPWPLWPQILRTSSSHEEGGERLWSIKALSFLGGRGRVRGVRCARVAWDADADGRPAGMADVPGSEFDLEADRVLLAMGFVGPGAPALAAGWGLLRDSRPFVAVDGRHETAAPGVFAAGDLVAGPSLVARAMADGRDAAEGILDYLNRG